MPLMIDREAFNADPCLPGVADPYSTYAALRQECAVHWCEGPRLWVIVSYAEALEHMRDHRYSRQSHLDKLIGRFGEERIFERQKLDIPYMDGEPHHRMRQHVTQAYRGINLSALSAFTREFVDRRLAGVTDPSRFDLVATVANLLPVMVVSELMGVPAGQQLEVAEKVSAFVRARGLTQTEETASGGDDAMETYRHYFLPLIQQRRAAPCDDLLSRLIADPSENVSLSDDQLLLIISSNFYSASIFTLRLLIGTLARAMALHPDTYARVRDDRRLIAPAIEEVLRWDAPAQALNASMATEDLEIDGRTIRAGDSVTVLVGAANHDPRVFDDPTTFRIDRTPNPHISFAPGLHQCLGLHLARMEGAAVLGALCDRFQALACDDAASERMVGDRFRGHDRLILEGRL
ncbi:cytochrome P450 [Synechococcus sp. CS-1328]|uniref:cytochrome P450 n=1 Tax=Synechococcus sp. CS-1328 TaxID=2847976 RepID=UPI00223AAEF2|nr:cytochrome P450 [Synechococcus sp. CS-1328]MCT0224796.1 cytochrome P450 [Synechococcus sp. CS-1328]